MSLRLIRILAYGFRWWEIRFCMHLLRCRGRLWECLERFHEFLSGLPPGDRCENISHTVIITARCFFCWSTTEPVRWWSPWRATAGFCACFTTCCFQSFLCQQTQPEDTQHLIDFEACGHRPSRPYGRELLAAYIYSKIPSSEIWLVENLFAWSCHITAMRKY